MLLPPQRLKGLAQFLALLRAHALPVLAHTPRHAGAGTAADPADQDSGQDQEAERLPELK